jgi:large subunit ribosomal protein L17
MRHRKHTSKLNRTSEHRLAMMRNLAIALVRHRRIRTTKVKAAQLRPIVEEVVTLAKAGDLHSRRLALSRICDKEAVHTLFSEIAPLVAARNGGYLRIVKDNVRMGDGAPMAVIEFVDVPVAAEGEAPKRKTLKQRLHERRKEMAKARR